MSKTDWDLESSSVDLVNDLGPNSQDSYSDLLVAQANEEPWLVSYADLMTLLFGFFAMLFTYATFDDEDFIRINRQIARYFGAPYSNSAAFQIEEKVKEQLQKQKSEVSQGSGAGSESPASQSGIDFQMKVAEDGREITFVTQLLFALGSAELLGESVQSIQTLIRIIQETEPTSEVRIEGHTDDNPISTQLYPSNWELSAARAGAILRLFEKAGFQESQLSIAGYGSSRPALPNRSLSGQVIEVNQAQNRRVIVRVLLPKGQKKNPEIDIKKKGPQVAA
jgi:chemotaxis protein MotB